MEKSTGSQIERKSSIESEPRTLTIHQIQFAREAAMYIVNNKSIEEAMSIFTKGLEPVRSATRQKGYATINSTEESDFIPDQIRLPPLLKGLRDVVSAPF